MEHVLELLAQGRGELQEAAALAEGGSQSQVHGKVSVTGSTSTERNLTQHQNEVRRAK